VFGPIQLEVIIYHFFQGRLYAVSLHTKDRDDTLGLLRIARAAFGKGNKPSELEAELDEAWSGKDAEAFFNVNPKTDEGDLLIRSNQLASEVEEYREKLTKEATNDF
jgi:hypothetical protein